VTLVGPQSHAGATRAAGAMLAVWSEITGSDSEAQRTHEVSERALGRDLWDELAGTLGVRLRPGITVVGNAVGHADVSALDAMRAAAPQATTVDPHEVAGYAPDVASSCVGALHLRGEASLDIDEAVTALTADLLDRGVHLVHGRVRTVELTGTDPRVLLADGRSLSARHVVLATGAETGQLVDLAQLGAPAVLGGRGVSMVVRVEIDLPHAVRTPNRAFACGLHLVPREDGTTYIGATNRLVTDADPRTPASLGEIRTLLDGAVAELNTGLSAAGLVRCGVGLRPLTVDRLPLVGRTRDPRLLLATGTYRNGVVLAPRIAALVREELAGPGRHAEHPFAPLRAQPDHAQLLRALLEGPGHGAADALFEDGPQLADHFVMALLRAVVSGDPQDPARLRALRLLQATPIEEVLPVLVGELSRTDPPAVI
jgi:glycine oxidase